MKIAVIDGMGGGIGSQTIEVIRSLNNKNIEIIALGTNISEAIASSPARKLLLPISKCNIDIIGLENLQFKTIFNELKLAINSIV